MKLLLVEDEVKLAKATKKNLELDGFTVEIASDADEALHLSEVDNYDLVILDRMLPNGRDGLEVCQIMRQRNWQGPILMLTALTSTSDKVDGLLKGADDYLAKPYSYTELKARIHALLRRPPKLIGPIVSSGEIKVDLAKKEVTNKGKIVNLTKREFLLLEFLLLNKNNTVSKQQIIEHVWDFDADILPNTVEAFIKSLRAKLDDKNAKLIKTIRGFGYRLVI